MRVTNMGAFQRLPVYRAKPLFTSLGQFDDSFEMPDEEVSVSDMSIPTSDQIDQQIIDESNSQTTTSEATPSQISPGSSSSSSSGGSSSTGFFGAVGNFFSSLFTPSTISAAAAAAKAAAAKHPGTVPVVPPAVPGALAPDTANLVLIGGATVVAVVLVSVLTRS